ncbi:ATP-binding protein [Halorientalis brevis]|uniref:histidine kinase n=1 Tax=Halorientalis brevis TaxID=1126241 RepID=A0ABD6CD84_9EURY|nr:GAF domain-containing sensor histidine kinase [Halorientalis brevis]
MNDRFPRILGSAIILCVGLASIASAAAHIPNEPARGVLFGVVPPLILSLGIVSVGGMLGSGNLPVDSVWRLVGWMVLGMLSAAGMAVLVIEYEAAHGVTIIHSFNVIVNSLAGGATGGLVVGYYDDRRRRWLEKHETTKRILETVRQINEHVVKAPDREALFDAICAEFAASEIYTFAWVGVLDPDTETVIPVTSAGVANSYLDAIEISMDDETLSKGPTAQAIQSGEIQTIQQIRTDPQYDPWRSTALEYGFRSSAAIPIQLVEERYGVLNIYSDRPAAFQAREQAVLSELGDTIAHAIYGLNVEQQQQEQYQKLERENERLDRFTSIVSHDLRNPLNVAQMYTETVSETEDLSYTDKIADAHERMETMIDDTLTLARDGRVVTDLQRVDLPSLVDQCWDVVDTGEATFENLLETAIQADNRRTRHLFENLIRNAVEHTGEAVTIRVGPLDDGFYVEDTGPGIPEAKRDDVFAPGHTTADDGTGFGLSIVKEIVEAHGWDIRITDGENGGARFEITNVETVE